MRRALVLALLCALPALAGPKTKRPHVADPPVPEALDLSRFELKPARAAAAPHADTRCEACHSTASWTDVRFAHEKTGFPLKDAHRAVDCKACHPVDFKLKVARECSGCHRDGHGGDLGARCEGCHDEATWRSRFGADAHRRSAFPLVGRHAFLPCEECHGEARDRAFSRPTVPCLSCHQRDYDRTRTTALDHARLGFSTDCRQCHGAWTFSRVRFPQHDACFQISGGPHAGVACLGCHSALSTFTAPGTCDTRTAACSSCHEHLCAKSDAQHTKVPGYQCRDRKCFECHRFTPEGR